MILSARDIHLSFSGVVVLRGARLDVRAGEVHILAGENGAGKTTLIKILAGVHTDYQGAIELDGRRVRFHSPQDAARSGISVIHQEMSLVGTLSAAENIFLGKEITRRFTLGLTVDHARQAARAAELCSLLGFDVDLRRPVEELSLSVRNGIEIAKALAGDSRILIMDEPTSALSDPEVDRLFRIIARLKEQGRAVIYVTHRMEEIYRIGDRITVLRDGEWVGTAAAGELRESELVRWMIGRDLETHFPARTGRPSGERLRVERFSVERAGTRSDPQERWLVRDAAFSVDAGEILGIAGLQDSGNSALLAALFGACPQAVRGRVFLEGRPFRVRSPRESIRNGLAYVPGDRKEAGLILSMNVAHNITLPSLGRISPGGCLRAGLERETAGRQARALDIRAPGLDTEVGRLSGGNQQKVLLAKWIATRPKVMLLDQPTRGVDVGAKYEIYRMLHQWAAAGIAILLVTSELQELLGLCDRILVMHRGRICAEYDRGDATREAVLRAAMGEPCAD